ncbi:MAG: OmpH family outer membrane protein [Deltaproteobacteria bacterium]|nr:OmpH family outer membrane protein [Deltaproteobacteria bacterium]
MRRCIKVFIGVFIIFSFAGLASAQELKIVYIDAPRILNESLAGKDAISKLEKFRGEKQIQIEEKEEALRKMGEEMSAKSLTMSQEAKDEKQMEYQKNVKEFNRFVKDAQEELKEKYDLLLRPVRGDLDEIIDNYGKEHNIDLILNIRQVGAVYASDRIDITDEILKIYDELYKSKTKEGSK